MQKTKDNFPKSSKCNKPKSQNSVTITSRTQSLHKRPLNIYIYYQAQKSSKNNKCK